VTIGADFGMRPTTPLSTGRSSQGLIFQSTTPARSTRAVRAVIAIENVHEAIDQIAQTTLRAVVGRRTLDETLSETEKINKNIREILDVQTEDWGVQVTLVELKDIQLPESMKRAMARQAEAEREKRAKIIAAEGEALAAGELAHAADVMMAHPLALQLRNLQTLVEIAVDKNSTVVLPAPLMSTILELGAFLNRETLAAAPPAGVATIHANGESATAPLMSTIQELGAFLNRETLAAAPPAGVATIHANGESATEIIPR
jgi:hypothetical protein